MGAPHEFQNLPLAPADLEVGFVLVCSAMVFLMQAGFCMLESGLVRAKNSINVAVKNLMDFGVSLLAFGMIGFTLMFGASCWGLFGSDGIAYWLDDKLTSFFIFQMVFCGTASTIVSGAIAERSKMRTYLFIVLILSGLVYPLIGHWCWGGVLGNTGKGWLANFGFVDWAGASVVHVTGGFAALAAIMAIGPRRHYRSRKLTSGHSLPLAVLGVFLIWFSWWGFNGGSGLNAHGNVALVILNTNLAAVAGLITSAIWSIWKTNKINVVNVICGSLAGLVSITAACHAVSPFAAVAIGAIGAGLSLQAIAFLEKSPFDDAVGAFGVHGVSGIWGTVAFGLFASPSALRAGSRGAQIGIQLLGSLVTAAFAWGSVYCALKLISKFMKLRVRAGEEKQGLNVIEHGATNELTDLLMTMSEHKQGNFVATVEIDTDSEVGQVASEYNKVVKRFHTEVSQHKNTNEYLDSERMRVRSLLEHAGVGIYQLDTEGRFQSTNKTLLQICGFASASTLIDSEATFQLPWHSDETRSEITQQLQSGGSVKNLETLYDTQTGEEVWLLEHIVPIHDSNGVLVSWLGTVNDISERKKAMMMEIEVAEAKSAAKGDFLANMSHEIRTPLNGVIGMLDLLGGSELDYKASSFVSIARSSAETLLSLINDILDFSKIEAGKMPLEHVSFDIRELMESTAEQFAIRAHLAGLELNCALDANLPYKVVGDPERIRQCIVNLLGNAVKFTEQGEINLRLSRRDDVVQFSVSDTGIGIEQEAQETLFDSFVQADAGTTRRYGGSGLGLSIVKQLVQLMGGELKLDSEVGKGSDFWFELELPVADEQTPIDHKMNLVETASDQNVLIVDDNTTNCQILTNQLSGWGLKNAICTEPTMVVQKLLVAEQIGNPFDLIILDFCMPGMNGSDVARAIQSHPTVRGVPIILLSSNHDLMSQGEMDELGICTAIAKPARQSRLFDAIVSTLYEARQSQQPMANENNVLAADTQSNASPTTGLQTVTEGSQTAPTLAESQPQEVETPTTTINNQSKPYEIDVLVVEDNHVNQIVAQQMLVRLGYTVEFAGNGKEALQLLAKQDYGLVLMDGHMPIMDGLTATRKIREWESNDGRRRTPIVALTANVVMGYRDECLEAGMDGYIAKPISLECLLKTLQQFLPIGSQQESEPSAVSSPSVSVPVSPTPVSQPLEAQSAASTALPIEGDTEGHSFCDAAALSQRCGGDTMFQRQLLEIMRDALPVRLEEIKCAGLRNNMGELGRISHQLKGAAGDTALLVVRERAAALEEQAKENLAQVIPATISELESDIEMTIAAIEKLLCDY